MIHLTSSAQVISATQQQRRCYIALPNQDINCSSEQSNIGVDDPSDVQTFAVGRQNQPSASTSDDEFASNRDPKYYYGDRSSSRFSRHQVPALAKASLQHLMLSPCYGAQGLAGTVALDMLDDGRHIDHNETARSIVSAGGLTICSIGLRGGPRWGTDRSQYEWLRHIKANALPLALAAVVEAFGPTLGLQVRQNDDGDANDDAYFFIRPHDISFSVMNNASDPRGDSQQQQYSPAPKLPGVGPRKLSSAELALSTPPDVWLDVRLPQTAEWPFSRCIDIGCVIEAAFTRRAAGRHIQSLTGSEMEEAAVDMLERCGVVAVEGPSITPASTWSEPYYRERGAGRDSIVEPHGANGMLPDQGSCELVVDEGTGAPIPMLCGTAL